MAGIRLTKRLEKVYELTPQTDKIADIGTDHGYLAVAFIEGGKANFVVASDINKGPLAAAKSYVQERNLVGQIDCRLGNGLQTLLVDEVDTVTICGMGGFLMCQLIKEAPYKPRTLILQPQNGRKELKQCLMALGYIVKKEVLVDDMGHMYDVWCWELGEGSTIYDALVEDDIRWEIGALICEQRDDLLATYLTKRIYIERKILQAFASSHKEQYQENEQYQEHYNQLKKLEECYHDYC